MAMIKSIPITFLTVFTSGAIAGSFDGPYVQAGLGFASLGSNISLNQPPYTESYNTSQTGTLGNVALGYSFELPKSFNIAANVFYNFGSQNAGQYNYGHPEGGSAYQNNLKNIWGISVEPGYNFGDKSLGFVKLGWATTSASITSSGAGAGEAGILPAGTVSAMSTGFLYGLGFKQLLTEHIYIGIEAYQVAFSSVNLSASSPKWGPISGSQKPNLTYGGINLGYKF